MSDQVKEFVMNSTCQSHAYKNMSTINNQGKKINKKNYKLDYFQVEVKIEENKSFEEQQEPTDQQYFRRHEKLLFTGNKTSIS